jgi:tight adherence protein B
MSGFLAQFEQLKIALLEIAVVVGGGIALAILGWTFAKEIHNFFRARWHSYKGFVLDKLLALHSGLSTRGFLFMHIVFALAGYWVGHDLIASRFWTVACTLLGVFGPFIWLKRAIRARRKALEGQLDSILQSLANNILVTQNLEDAFMTVAEQYAPPASQEADILVKQVRLGSPMDDALADFGLRAQSRYVDAIVMALTIGRKTGAELPKTLEKTAKVIRETLRVEGMMDSKTAEGKAQIFMLAAAPVVFAYMADRFNPGWLDPMFHDPIGWALLGLACLLEAIALGLALKFTRLEV